MPAQRTSKSPPRYTPHSPNLDDELRTAPDNRTRVQKMREIIHRLEAQNKRLQDEIRRAPNYSHETRPTTWEFRYNQLNEKLSHVRAENIGLRSRLKDFENVDQARRTENNRLRGEAREAKALLRGIRRTINEHFSEPIDLT
jgi:predicted  nucleic acid-binding Zn-ribbon protein